MQEACMCSQATLLEQCSAKTTRDCDESFLPSIRGRSGRSGESLLAGFCSVCHAHVKKSSTICNSCGRSGLPNKRMCRAVSFLTRGIKRANPTAYKPGFFNSLWSGAGNRSFWFFRTRWVGSGMKGFRWSITGTGDPPSQMLLVSAIVVVAVLVAGMMYFQKMNPTIADVV